MIWDKSFLMLLTFDPLAPMGNRLNWKNRAASVERKKFLVCAQMCFRSKMCVSITNMQLCLHFQEQDRAKTFTLTDTKLSTEVNIVKLSNLSVSFKLLFYLSLSCILTFIYSILRPFISRRFFFCLLWYSSNILTLRFC